ncbi:MAG: hypothetical protein R2774_03725 [Saprospiraceae bacterium]
MGEYNINKGYLDTSKAKPNRKANNHKLIENGVGNKITSIGMKMLSKSFIVFDLMANLINKEAFENFIYPNGNPNATY